MKRLSAGVICFFLLTGLVFLGCEFLSENPDNKNPVPPKETILVGGNITADSEYILEIIRIEAYSDAALSDGSIIGSTTANITTGLWTMEISGEGGTVYFKARIKDESGWIETTLNSVEIPETGKNDIAFTIGPFAPPQIAAFSMAEIGRAHV